MIRITLATALFAIAFSAEQELNDDADVENTADAVAKLFDNVMQDDSELLAQNLTEEEQPVDGDKDDVLDEDNQEEEEWDQSKPIELDATNFWGKVVDNDTQEIIGDKNWFIEFFAPWCPHCQHLNPVWDEFHGRNKETLNIARVDCTTKNGKALCQHFEIKGYPSLLFFTAGTDDFFKYSGARSIDGFEKWITKQGWSESLAQEIKPPTNFFDDSSMAGTVLNSLVNNFLQ